MTTYKGIKGLSIQTVAGDPSNLALGDIWYDSGARKVQGAKTPAGAWSTGADLNASKHVGGSCGTVTAGLAFFGDAGPFLANSEEYDGTSWTEGSNVNTGRSRPTQNIGTQTAGIAVGGRDPGNVANVEEYDGTSWSEVSDIPIGTERGGGAGIQTSALSFGGRSGAGTSTVAETFEYDGTNWTDGGDLPVVNKNQFGFGTQTAAVGAGGYNTALVAEAYTYNGTAWADDGNNNTSRKYGSPSGTSQNYGNMGGGDPGGDSNSALMEQYDGTSWTELADLNTAVRQTTGTGSGSSALSIAGVGYSLKAEEWDQNIAASTFTSS